MFSSCAESATLGNARLEMNSPVKGAVGPNTYLLGNWAVDPTLNRVQMDAVTRRLEPRAMDVLVHLMNRPAQVVSSEELLKHYWTRHTAEPRKISKRINQIRKALDDDARQPTYIETIHKRGYRVVAPVSLISASTPMLFTGNREGERLRVAVLPFANLSRDPKHDHVSEGIAAELIVSLGQRDWLEVPGRLSVLSFRDSKAPLKDIAGALAVEFVVTGTVSIENDRFCVTTELTSAGADWPVWTSRFEGESALSLRQEIAESVGTVRWLSGEPIRDSVPADLGLIAVTREANEAFQDALSSMGTQDFFQEWLPKATERFEHVVQLKPDHAEAWSYLALLEALRCARSGNCDFTRCTEFAQQALAIDAEHALPHVALGYVALLGDWDIDRARLEFDRALERSPTNPAALNGYHLLLRVLEDHDGALDVADRLRQAAPSDLGIRAEVIKFHYESRLYEEATLAAESVRTSIPGYTDFSEAAALHRTGRFADSYRARLSAYRLLGEAGTRPAAILEAGLMAGGYVRALQMLSDYQLAQRASCEGLVAREFLFLPGNSERLINRLKGDIDQRQPAMIGLVHNPDYDPVRTHPNFSTLLDRVMPGRVEDNPARLADVCRINIFQGNAGVALDSIQRVIRENSDDRRTPRWMESMAWACFATGDYGSSIRWSDTVLDRGVGAHARAHAQLIKCASLVEGGRSGEARNALRAAAQAWPEELNIARDIEPLFFSGDQSLKKCFISALVRVTSSIENEQSTTTLPT